MISLNFLSIIILYLIIGVQSQNLEKLYNGEEFFYKAAKSIGGNSFTDKVGPHHYQTMYGFLLLPTIEKFSVNKKKLKFLEIGYGCGQLNVGASVKLWNNLFADLNVEKWEAEYDLECINLAKSQGLLAGWNLLLGDQGNVTTLDRWVKESGGNFDIIIDDGGHVHNMVLTSLSKLWPQLNPDGYYYIEDLEVAFWFPEQVKAGFPPVTKVLQAWIEVMHVGDVQMSNSPHHKAIISHYPLPEGLDFILCQKHACVLHKKPSNSVL